MAMQNESVSLLALEAQGANPAEIRIKADRLTKSRRFGLAAGACMAAALVFYATSPLRTHRETGVSSAVGFAAEAEGQMLVAPPPPAAEAESHMLVAPPPPTPSACTTGRGNCNATKCCAGPGLQCYEQNQYYAQCRESCIASAPDPTHWDGGKWTCKELGARAEGEPVCGHPGDDCSQSKCCADPGHQCYEKLPGWATCKPECVPNAPDMTDIDGKPWSCKMHGERTTSTQDWVAGQCSSGWDNCLEKMCCANAGEQCCVQNEGFGECAPVGTCGGTNTGPVTPAGVKKGGMVPEWALKKCGKLNDGCSESKCCLGMDVACYAKSDDWAMCMQTCEPGKHKEDNNDEWSCEQIGPRSYGLATKGFPSLYCFSVIRVDGYERELMQANNDRQSGLFACDDFDILTADGETTVGDMTTISFPGAEIVTSIDGTAGNTDLFVNAWNAVMDSGKWRNHAFICKIDPDAVFIPDRVRTHMEPYVDANMFVINCMVGDMIYGALEVFSYEAINQWSMRKGECNAPNVLGEDKYMTQCMDTLGVARVHDIGIVGDKLCGTFSDCSNGFNAAFHPFKDVPSWSACMDEAMR